MPTLKILCVKDSVHRVKRQPTEREKTRAKHVSDEGLISRLYKETQLNSRRICAHAQTHANHPTRKRAKDSGRHFSGDIWMTNKHRKRRATSLIIR